jgi:hypothetical protein
MMKKFTAVVLCLSAALSLSAQKTLHRTPQYVMWEPNPHVHPVPPEYAREPAVILHQDVNLDYRFAEKGIEVYYTLHRLVKVLDEKGIETFNKIGIPVSSRTRVPSIKARTISSNGKVRDIAKDMIKVTKNEYGMNEVVIAMENVEKNSEIELLLEEIRPFSLFGSEIFQYPVRIMEAHFSMSYPKELVFEEKGYNGFPDVRDTLLNNRRHIDVTIAGIPPLKDEPNTFYDRYRMRAEYHIHHFTDNTEHPRAYTWEDLGRGIFNDHYRITDKERKAVNRFLSDIGVPGGGDEMDNIRKIEEGIKNTIGLYAYAEGNNTEVLDTIITKKAATEDGYIKLFAACFAQAGVSFELGMAVNRNEHWLDKNFENWNNLNDHLFYFPNLKQFLAPTYVYYRFPVLPLSMVNTKGIFCIIPPKQEKIGGEYEFRNITPLSLDENTSNIAADVSFSKDMNATVDVTYSYSGYPSTDLREALVLLPKDRHKEVMARLVPLAEKPEQVIQYTTANEDFSNYYSNKPLEIQAKVNAPQLVEKGGKNYLFKLGDIIGHQQELYSRKDRTLPVDLPYAVSKKRTITINIPKGYRIKNPEAIRINADYVDRDLKPVIAFSSDYTFVADKKNGDKLIVTVNEVNRKLHYSPAEYTRYRQVVNAAADFNNVTLLMEKKG